LNKVQFDSMAFQERNEIYGIKPERSGWNLAEKSGTDRDLKWEIKVLGLEKNLTTKSYLRLIFYLFIINDRHVNILC
jgi:hypothetical protein